MKGVVLAAAIFAASAVLLPAAADAQSDIGVRRVGIRGGLTVDPDQVHVGLHINAGQFADKVRFQPSFDIGFGNDRVVGTINLDAFYTFEPGSVAPYAGAGIGVSLSDRGSGNGGGDDFDVGAGLNLVAGFEWGDDGHYMLEARAGVGSIPDFKLTVGVNF